MDQQSVVYGCIKDTVFGDGDTSADYRRSNNREVMQELPSVEEWPLLSREMFAMPVAGSELEEDDDGMHTDVMHFGSSYKAVEYEWEQWLAKFEAMLKRMYWVSATVHLQTELNGTHTFSWESHDEYHAPSESELSVRCEWSREAAI